MRPTRPLKAATSSFGTIRSATCVNRHTLIDYNICRTKHFNPIYSAVEHSLQSSSSNVHTLVSTISTVDATRAKQISTVRVYSSTSVVGSSTASSLDESKKNIPVVHSGLHAIDMPMIMNVKAGVVKQWLKRVGEKIRVGESLCEVTLNDFTVAIDATHNGIMAQILVPVGGTAAAETPIASFARNTEEYFTFLDDSRSASSDAVMGAAVEELMAEQGKHPTASILMRTLRHLISAGLIDKQTDVAKQLLSLSRKGDPELLAAFEASYEGVAFNEDTFDAQFFISNATEIIEERRSLREK